MVRALTYFVSAAVLWCGLTLAALAQSIDYQAWDQVASQIERSIEEERVSVEGLDALRESVVFWRDQFLEGTSANGPQIETLEGQIDALGAAPAEGESEPEEIATQREELTARLSEARAPRIAAETALARANTLISQIDGRIRNLQTDAIFELQRSPLLPGNWVEAVSRFGRSLADIRTEVSEAVQGMRAGQTLGDRIPLAVILLLGALFLIVRGPRLVENLVVRVEAQTSEQGQVFFGFLVSLGGILLPLIGVSLINAALVSTGLLGEVGRAAALGINLGIIAFSVSRWLGGRIFPEGDGSATPVALTLDRRRRGRLLSRLAGLLLAFLILMRVIDDVEDYDGVLLSVLAFPAFVLLGLTLFFLGRLLREGRDTADETSSYGVYLLGLTGRLLQIVGLIAPVVAAIGYYNLARGLIVPITLTLALAAFLATLHYVIRAAYGLIRGLSAEESDNALVPVLISFSLTALSLPLVALFWGARQTDLVEIWTRFRTGVQVGDATISPGDFLTVILVFVLGLMVTRLVQGVLRNSVLPRTRLDKGGRNAAVSGMGYVGITLAALAGITAAGIDLSSLAIVVGALGVGIGFGLQNIVNNFVSGIILLIERPIGEGDWVDVNGNFGVVKSISVRSTVIETFDKTDVIVPNGDLVSGTVTNWTRGNSIGRVIVPVGVAYGTDTRLVERILKEIAEAHPIVAVTPPPLVLFRGFGADSLDFEIRAILTDVSFIVVVQSDLNHEIARRFTEEGIEIPFAQRDIWLRNPEALQPGKAETAPYPPSAAPDMRHEPGEDGDD